MVASIVEQAITVIGLVTHSWKSYLVPFLELYCDNTRLQYDKKKRYSQMRCYLNLRRQMSGWLILTETTQSYLFFFCEYLKCHSAPEIQLDKYLCFNVFTYRKMGTNKTILYCYRGPGIDGVLIFIESKQTSSSVFTV